MRVWLIHMGENVQSDGPDVRLYRLGILADYLASRGHRVERWVPTFTHNHLRQRFDEDTDVWVSDRHVIRHIYAAGFKRHRSPARMRFHREVARRWRELGRTSERPDVILTSLPTPEVADAGIDLGAHFNCPVVVDIRDLWPDVYVTMLPGRLRPLGRLLLAPARARASRTLRASDSVVAVSRAYLDWGLELADLAPRRLDRVFPLSYQPPVVDEARVAEATRVWERRLSGTRLTCVFLGTFTRFFTMSDVVEAARILEQRHPGAVAWVLAGDGPMRESVVASATDLPQVHLPGWVDGPESTALLRLASVGLAPYSADAPQSLPNKPFEYACAGLPVLSSLVGELRDLIDEHDTGANYPSGAPDRLAALVEGYLHDPDSRERQGKAGQTLYESEMAPPVIYDRFVDHLEEVAASRPSPARHRKTTDPTDNGPRGYVGKRGLDVVCSVAGLVLLAPVFAVVAMLVRLSSRGPVIYRGARVGCHGRDFQILKFRTMRDDVTTQLTTAKDDPRVTAIGRILRKYKLDELPQLINVLRGEMSLVGPRPEFRHWVDRYSDEELEILTARPGITDLASLEFYDLASVVGDSDDPDAAYVALAFGRKNALRLEYVRTMSLRADLRIIARTLSRVFE